MTHDVYKRLLLMLALLCVGLHHLSAEDEMPIIAYMGVPYDKTTDENFKTFSECGFNVSLYIYPSLEQMIKACNIANKYGVKILGHCTDTHDNPEKAASVMKNVPGFFGYVIKDEPTSDAIKPLQQEISKLKKADDKHCFYINLHPYYNEGTLRHLKTRTYEEYLDIALSTSCKQLSFDFYPITANGIRPVWYHNLEMVRRRSLANNKPFWGFVLSVPHDVPFDEGNYYPTPTLASLRLQIYANLAYGAQAIQYFTYWTPGNEEGFNYHDAPISHDGKKTNTYPIVQRMNKELKVVSQLFYGAHVLSVNHLGIIPEGTTRQATMPINIKSLKIAGRQGAIVSQFEKQGHRYLAIVNKDYQHSMQTHIKTKNNTPRQITKELAEQEVKNTYTIAPGDILLFKLK